MINETINATLTQELFGNTLGDYILAAVSLVGILIALWIFKAVVISSLHKIAKKTQNKLDDYAIELLSKIGAPTYALVAIYVATRSLIMDPMIDKILTFVLIIVLTFKVIRIIQEVLGLGVTKFYLKGKKDDLGTTVATRNIIQIINWILWSAGALFVLDNLGIDITAVVAGLGIGGVAVALAAQAILGDLFSSFAIFLDKPFEVGDFIIVDDHLGVVENIGIKTTRVRSLWGEQLVFSNSDLTNSRVRNYKRMEKRRVAFKFGVTYQTTAEQLKAIPPIVKEIVASVDKAKIDRVHFFSFGDFSLDFEVVYYVDGNDYNLYMDIQQEINLQLKQKLEAKGIEFAYPTQTVYVAK